MTENANENRPEEIPEAELVQLEINYCVFNVGNARFCLAITDVKEITDPVNIFYLPASPEHVKGLIHLRGVVIPVIDMAKAVNIAYLNETGQKLIIVEHKGESIALLADQMPDLVADQEGELIELKTFFEKYKIK